MAYQAIIDPTTFFATALLAAVSAILLLLLFRLVREEAGLSPPLPPPDEIIALRVYPVKSCRGFEVKSTRLLRTGLDLDRNWMFISAENREFLTIRANSNMTLIRTHYNALDDQLTISIKDDGTKIHIPAHPTSEWLESNTKLGKAGIWGEQTDAWEYPTSLTEPFSKFLCLDVRLVYKGPTPRVLRGCGSPKHLGRTEATKFADMMPVLVASEASMKELNKRLARAEEHQMDIERFRPNVIIRGGEPWSEDSWKTLSITDGKQKLDMDVVSRCLRCQVPNVDPNLGKKHPKEPWYQLVKYRRIDGGNKYKPSFGMLCVARNEGNISVGMKFHVMAVTKDHFFINPMKPKPSP